MQTTHRIPPPAARNRALLLDLLERGGKRTLQFGHRDFGAGDLNPIDTSTLPDELGQFSVLRRLGVQFINFGESPTDQDIVLPELPPSASWGDPLDASATLGIISMTPRRLTAKIPFSRQLVKQSALAYTMLEQVLLQGIAFEIEKAALVGDGTGGSPEGIMNDSAVATIAETPSLTNIAAAEKAITDAWCGPDVVALVSTACRLRFRTPAAANSIAWPTAIPMDCSPHLTGDSAIVMNPRDLVIGLWGSVELLLNPYTDATEGISTLFASVYVDIAYRRPEGLNKIVA